MNIVNFLFNDFISLLGLVVFIGGFILLIVVVSNLIKIKDEVEEEEKTDNQKDDSTVVNDELGQLLETFIKAISDDLTEIKTQLNEIKEMQEKQKTQTYDKDLISDFNTQIQAKIKSMEIEDLKKEMKELNNKLSSIYNVLSKLSQ